MIKNIAYNIIAILLLFSLTFISSCDTFDAEAEVPAYVQIDTFKVVTNSVQGTNQQNITDVWFNLDGSQVGVFEMPKRFPVIAKGRRPVSIRAGILKSGIHDFREAYPFFKTIRDTFDFVGTEVISYTPVFEYKDEAEFWIEDFEDPGMKLQTSDSTNYLEQMIDPDNSSNHVGYIHLPDTADAFQTYTKNKITLSNMPIYMEVDYKCDQAFGIGILVERGDGSYETVRPFTLVKPNEDWNKLYLNLAEQFYLSAGARSYDVYFFFATEENETSTVYLDNIKIVSF